MKRTKKITLSAIFSALSVVLLYLGSILSILDISMAALASFAVVFAHIEMKAPWQWLIYALTSLLSFLLLPVKTAALFYTCLFGFYPMLKAWFERLPRLFSWILKILTCNILMAIFLYIAIAVLKLPDYTELKPLLLVVVPLANLVFVIYDIALSRCILGYSLKFRHRIAKYLD